MKGHEKAAVELAWVFYMTFSHVEILLSFLVYPDQKSQFPDVNSEFYGEKLELRNINYKGESQNFGKLEFWVYMCLNVYFVLF